MQTGELVDNLASPVSATTKQVKPSQYATIRALQWWDVAAGLALVAWIFALSYVQGFHLSFVGTDPIIHYFPAAQKFLDGQGYQAFAADVYRGPGYPLMLAGITSLLQDDMFTASKVIAVISSVLFLLFAYLFLRKIFEPRTALAAMLLTMAVNTFAFVSCIEGTDMPFAALVMASLFFLVRHEVPTRFDAALSGILGGLALTVRWNGLFLPLLVLVGIGLVPKRETDLRLRIQLVGFYVLAFLVTSGPWLYVNYLLHGSPLYNESLNPSLLDQNLFPPSTRGLDSMLQVVQQDPVSFGQKFIGKVFGSFPVVINGLNNYPWPQGWVMAGAFWIFILVGAVLLLMRIDRAKLWLIVVSIIWWASLVPVHFEARFYVLLIPTFSALAVYVVTSRALPDVWLATGQVWRPRLELGSALDWLAGRRFPNRVAPKWSGVSITSVALSGILTLTAFSEVDFLRSNYEAASSPNDFYHELALFIRQSNSPVLLRAIGTRQWSQARYWIPREAGVPVSPLPNENYLSSLSKLSYVLYDQIDNGDTPVFGWDDPNIVDLRDPLHAPAGLEPVYYKPSPPRAILYRILDQNNPAKIVSASASSAQPQNPATQTLDDDAATWWSSPSQAQENASESITFGLDKPTPISRIWLLPRQDGEAFPAGIRMEVSTDSEAWQSVVDVEKIAKPIQQNPQIFSFGETIARFVRITITHLRWDEAEKGYLTSLAEVRISSATERPDELPVFSISPADLFFDPLTNALAAKVHNQSEISGRATVEFSEGWSTRDIKLLGIAESSPVMPEGDGIALLPLGGWQTLKLGDCWPIWATIKPYGKIEPDVYSAVFARPQTVFQVVCSPTEVPIDDFNYAESPLTRGWTVPPDETAKADVTTTIDPELGKRVMKVSTQPGEQFVIRHQIQASGTPKLTLWIKAQPDFIIYVQVRGRDGEYYYVQYMPFAWPKYSQEFPAGRYIYFPLGSQYADGKWHKLERDVYRDFTIKTGKEVDYIEFLTIRAFGNLEIADPKVGVGR